MDKETAINKIRKCLALAKSSEPNEAAAAMRQAQKLMAQFGIEHPELVAAAASEEWNRSASKIKPPSYEARLANMVADAFSCDLLFKQGYSQKHFEIQGGWAFIGVEPSPTIASYSYAVLRRQLTKARTEYANTALKRHRKNKVAAADLFCEGWVRAVSRLVAANKPTPEHAEAIAAYKATHYKETSKLQKTERQLTTQARDSEGRHLHQGWLKGKEAQLNNGVAGTTHQQIGN